MEARGDPIDESGGDRMQQGRRQPDREFAVTQSARRQRDDPGDERRLRVIAECRMQGPEPVLRLVGIKLGACHSEPEEARGGQPDDCGCCPQPVGAHTGAGPRFGARPSRFAGG